MGRSSMDPGEAGEPISQGLVAGSQQRRGPTAGGQLFPALCPPLEAVCGGALAKLGAHICTLRGQGL